MEPSAYILLIIAALVPAVLYMLYVISFDRRQPEPALALISSAIVGMVAGFAVTKMGLSQDLESLMATTAHDLKESAVIGFLRLAVPAEIIKWVALIIFLSLNRYFDEYVDGIVYSTCLAMGFAGVWGVWFCSDVIRPLLPSLMEQAIFLFLILVPIHLASGTMMGYFFGLARDKKYKLLNSLKALFLAILVDGLLCSLVFFIGNSWTYYFILGILFSILSKVFYTQIYPLLEKDVEEAKGKARKNNE